MRQTIGPATVRVWRTEGLEHIIIILIIIWNQRAGQARPGQARKIRTCLYRITARPGRGRVGSGENPRESRWVSPWLGLARTEVPRLNTQLWELILGNYNPGDCSSVQGDQHSTAHDPNVQIDFSFVFPQLVCSVYSILSTLGSYFCLNKINKLSKFDINTSGWLVMDFLGSVVSRPPTQFTLLSVPCTALYLREKIKYGNKADWTKNHNCSIIKYWSIIMWLRMSKKINILSWFLCDVYQTVWHQAIRKKWQDVDFNLFE